MWSYNTAPNDRLHNLGGGAKKTLNVYEWRAFQCQSNIIQYIYFLLFCSFCIRFCKNDIYCHMALVLAFMHVHVHSILNFDCFCPFFKKIIFLIWY